MNYLEHTYKWEFAFDENEAVHTQWYLLLTVSMLLSRREPSFWIALLQQEMLSNLLRLKNGWSNFPVTFVLLVILGCSQDQVSQRRLGFPWPYRSMMGWIWIYDLLGLEQYSFSGKLTLLLLFINFSHSVSHFLSFSCVFSRCSLGLQERSFLCDKCVFEQSEGVWSNCLLVLEPC